MNISENNRRIFELYAKLLNLAPRAVDGRDVAEISRTCSVPVDFAYAQLVAATLGLDSSGADRDFFRTYILPSVKALDISDYDTEYSRTVRVPEIACGRWRLGYGTVKAYEAFVADDPDTFPNGTVIPHIGFFTRDYRYPVIYEDEREWMTVTVNEINTMRTPISRAHGNVLTFGLGLGYFAFCAARKTEVSRVTVIERDKNAVDIFEKHILPEFPDKDKIRIILADAFEYAENEMQNEKYDFAFCDIWHDPTDGVAEYKKFKSLEKNSPDTEFSYWIEKTLLLYM